MITLNLIPPVLKDERRSSIQLHRWLNAIVVLCITILVGSAGSGAVWFMMQGRATTVQSELQRLQQSQSTANGQDITLKTSQLNATIKTLITTLGTPRSWASDIAIVLTGLPKTVSIDTLTIQSTDQFHLVGVADSRQTYVQLEATLKANTKLQNITAASTASKRVAVPFDFSGQLLNPEKP